MPEQQEFICGLSHEVTIAVLPRLNMQELMFELNRRITGLDKENSIKDRLVSILRDLMLEEYRQLERKSKFCSSDEMTTTVQELETVTVHDSFSIAFVDTMSSASNNPTFITQVLDTNIPTSNSCAEKPSEGDIACEETPLEHRETYLACQPISEQASENKASSLTDNGSRIGRKQYLCDVCGFKTLYASSFSIHIRTHTGEKPFKCSQCDYKSISKGDLARHLKRHTEEKPHSCEMCDYKTYRKSDLKTHMRRHTGAKPYKCEQCDYKTAYQPGLVRHRRRHTGERPFSCQQCDYKAGDRSCLIKHMRKKH
ncbi:uncharacterized protein LOC144865651 [Branchiostoma floridae x Branchiostoma japonicum]